MCTRFCLCPPRVCFPVLCKFWKLYGGVNDDILQEGLCHTQIYCTQSPCSRPLLTLAFTGDSPTLKDESGSVSVGSSAAHKIVSALPASLVGIRFDFKCDFTPSYHLTGASPLPLDVGYIFLVGSNILLSLVIQQGIIILDAIVLVFFLFVFFNI